MKTYGGWRNSSTFLNSALDKGDSSALRPSLFIPREKWTQYPLGIRLGEPLDWTLLRRGKLCHVQPVAGCYTDWTIPTPFRPNNNWKSNTRYVAHHCVILTPFSHLLLDSSTAQRSMVRPLKTRCFLTVRDQISHPYKWTGTIMRDFGFQN
jgi:hypothetical protein